MESNPEVHDVLGVEEADVSALPGKLKALLFVLPKDEFYEEALNDKASDSNDTEAFFIKQSADNLCGSICLIHAVVNGIPNISLDEDSPLKSYLDAVTDLDPVARGEALLAHDTLIAAHNDAAAGGQSSSEGATLHHMICFVGINGGMTDLD